MKDKNYYIAIDLGAESGRVIVGTLKNYKLLMKDVHRFSTKQIIENKTIYWDIEFIYREIKKGIRKAASLGYDTPRGVGVDSWGVDFGLLDKNNALLENPIAYRDKRTDGMMEKVFEVVPRNKIYKTAGIQFLKFNSIYQLFSLVLERPELLKKTKSFLMIPDLINFFFTGRKFNEYTNLTTSSLLNSRTRTIEKSLFNKLSIPVEIMESLIFPASKIACMKTELSSELGLKNSDVFAVGSHDTASAIVAVPAEGNNWAYLSSGTWSLLGIETNKPILTKKAQECSFTNEGGVDNTIRFLKNIMGLWILQGVRLNWLKANEDLDYSVITELAENGKPFQAFFNPDDERFFNPDDMLNELESYFIETKQNIPNGIGATARVILENLSFKVAYYLEQLGDFKDGPIQVLHIVGGGSKNVLLNQLISNACNIKVIAGPDEGTAAGNIMTQALATSDVNSLAEIRKYIHNSFDIVEYNPEDQKEWKENYKRFLEKCNLDGEK